MINKYSAKYQNKLLGFTIVELLIVVVVIGILATITVVSYNGIAQRAAGASLQSDLSGASTQLQMYQVENGSYPTTIDCNGGPQPLPPAICLQSSSGNSYLSYGADNSTQPQTFRLVAKNGSNKYGITNDSSPYLIVPVVASGGIMTTFEEYTIHTFNESGTLAITSGVISDAEVLVIGGGGGGGADARGMGYSGGGGAGQFLAMNNLSISGLTTVTVGNGGSAGINGTSSVLGAYGSSGGGAGGTASVAARSGASGGGGYIGSVGGVGMAGFNGGDGGSGGVCGGQPGGGGGSGSTGFDGGSCSGSMGGYGLSSSITGAQVWYASGGSAENAAPAGGGGQWGSPGVPNTGGGGFANTSGGSGVVIIRYLTD